MRLLLRQRMKQYGFEMLLRQRMKQYVANTKEMRSHKRIKHIDWKYHLIREAIAEGIVNVMKVGSKDNLADLFTKTLARELKTETKTQKLVVSGLVCETEPMIQLVARLYWSVVIYPDQTGSWCRKGAACNTPNLGHTIGPHAHGTSRVSHATKTHSHVFACVDKRRPFPSLIFHPRLTESTKSQKEPKTSLKETKRTKLRRSNDLSLATRADHTPVSVEGVVQDFRDSHSLAIDPHGRVKFSGTNTAWQTHYMAVAHGRVPFSKSCILHGKRNTEPHSRNYLKEARRSIPKAGAIPRLKISLRIPSGCMTRRNPSGLLLFDEEIDRTARRNRREIRHSLRYTEEEQEDDISTTTEEMAENQDNPLPPAILAELANQNAAPRTIYDYAKPNFTGTESSIVKPAVAANNFELKPNTIQMIQQFMDLETLYDAWERFKDLLRRCPHHGLPLWLQVQTFYNGVNPSIRQMIDAAAGGTINNKTPKDAYEFIEEMSLNNYQWQVMRTKQTKTAGLYNIDSVTMLSNQVELLNKKIDGLLGSTQVHPVMRCDSSGGGVPTEYPPFNSTTEEEQVNYMGNNNFRSQNNPYSNTYNVGWKNHPNFSWGGQQNQRPQNPQNFQQPPYQQEKKLNLEEMLSKFISVSETHFKNTETALKNQQASIQGLETQIGQLSKLISKQPQGGLQKVHVKAVTLRSEKVLAEAEKKLTQEAVIREREEEKPKNSEEPVQKEYKPSVPYPAKLKKDRMDAQFVEHNEECSAILQNKLPTKLKDPRSFTIPCLIGSLNVEKALADLGASINLMPYKMFKQLGLGEPKPTRMSIQLADRSVRYPKGIIEDVLMKVDKFIFPVNFVVLDIDEDVEVPLILGRPFLAIARAVIDMGDGKLVLRVGDEEIIFKIYYAMRFSREQDDSCYFIDFIDHATQDSFQEIIQEDTTELYLAQEEESDDDLNEHPSRRA
ncbi:hypothetical protein CXB51_014050 [Gossypium anomalum]|uniref:Retrotransposon gag domain-containing protein n=1 Tax=Gossypium anomalum TaxID=47600 RepID=A0A8J5YYT4_9ROSI|nr:hypothetical protein CXB51_014050 [Gossypium anomalum]